MQQLEDKHSLLPHNIPIPISKSQSEDGFLYPDTDIKYEKFSNELSQRYIGPMPAGSFVTTFLPVDSQSDEAMPFDYDVLKAVFATDSVCIDQEVMTELCKYFNSAGRCPNFRLDKTAGCSTCTISRPDLCLFDLKETTSNFACSELFIQIKALEAREDPFRDSDGGPDISNVGFIRDIYEELEDEDENEEDEDEELEIEDNYTRNRGEIAVYAAELFARQFRTHCFSISIYGTKVRFFRWDRAGVIISSSFDATENPELLCQFMWRYANATDAQRGHDTSVARASKEEEDIFAKVVRNHIKEQLSVEDIELDNLVKEHYEPNSVFRMSIFPRLAHELDDTNPTSHNISSHEPRPWDELWREVDLPLLETPPTALTNVKTGILPTESCSRSYSEVQYFLVSRPVVAPFKIACRGTRGYWSVKVPDESIGEREPIIAFMKDTWREVNEDIDIEGDTIIGNIEAGVKFISDILCHGDVKIKGTNPRTSRNTLKEKNSHVTQTRRYAKAKWNNIPENRKPIPILRHYRMASVEVGYPLSTFRGTKELVHGVRCAFLAAWAAYVLRGRLHRDISLNNIILVKKNRKWRIGMLIDWELSTTVGEDGKAKDTARSGTWAFMSIALLGAKDFKHRLQDDMESTFYVLLFSSILWLPRVEVKNLEDLLDKYFDEHIEIRGVAEGGTYKGSNLLTGFFQSFWRFDNHSLQKCLDDMVELQRPLQEQPDWTPEAFYSVIKSADKEDLPLDDRTDHRQIKEDKIARRRAWLDLQYESVVLSAKSVPSLKSDSEQTLSVKSEASSSKRSVDDAELEECAEPIKRPCILDELQDPVTDINQGYELF